jgi:hypothetical protein
VAIDSQSVSVKAHFQGRLLLLLIDIKTQPDYNGYKHAEKDVKPISVHCLETLLLTPGEAQVGKRAINRRLRRLMKEHESV